MSEVQSEEGPLTVVGYGHREGRTVTMVLASASPTAPPVGLLVVGLVAGLFPLTFPFAVWTAVRYWRAPLSQWRWRCVALLMVGLGLLNVVGFLAYGYGRHFTIF